jgi:hypothetical protein
MKFLNGAEAQAFEADQTNVAVLTNRAAVRFEQKNYDECVNDCRLAIETGRSVRADFKVRRENLLAHHNQVFEFSS